MLYYIANCWRLMVNAISVYDQAFSYGIKKDLWRGEIQKQDEKVIAGYAPYYAAAFKLQRAFIVAVLFVFLSNVVTHFKVRGN